MRLLLLLLIVVLIKSVLWAKTVPVFQTPDEQAHFAQLSYIAENKTLSIAWDKNLSQEIATVEEILGTRRDGQGNNKYTYHPEYKNNSPIPNLPMETRFRYVDREAAGYPPLYYLLDLPFYYLTYSGNVGDRVMASRLLSTISHLALVICAYFTGKLIWDDKIKSLVLAVMVGFQPMVSFVAAGIHPDNLLNLITTAMIFICFLIMKHGIKLKYLLSLVILGILGWETKISVAFLFPAVAAVIIPKLSPLTLGIPAVAFIFKWNIPYMPYVGPESPLSNMSLTEYLKFRLPKLAFEMWPWFWGVFKWLGVTLPAIVLKIITRLAIVSGIGLVLTRLKNKYVIASIVFVVTYTLYLFMWDWRLMQSMGYSQGLQGRYLFPVIVPIMIIFLEGLGKFGKVAVIGTGIGMVILNSTALWLIKSLY